MLILDYNHTEDKTVRGWALCSVPAHGYIINSVGDDNQTYPGFTYKDRACWLKGQWKDWSVVKTCELCLRGSTCSGQNPSCLSIKPHRPFIGRSSECIHSLTTVVTPLPSESEPLPSVAWAIVILPHWSLSHLPSLPCTFLSIARMIFYLLTSTHIALVTSCPVEKGSRTPLHGCGSRVLCLPVF